MDLYCDVRGNPKPLVSWIRKGGMFLFFSFCFWFVWGFYHELDAFYWHVKFLRTKRLLKSRLRLWANMKLAVRHHSEWIFKCLYLISKIKHHRNRIWHPLLKKTYFHLIHDNCVNFLNLQNILLWGKI